MIRLAMDYFKLLQPQQINNQVFIDWDKKLLETKAITNQGE
jgi:hypothetical protein